MEITVEQFKLKQIAYLKDETKKHARQVVENQAKVTENEELIRRIENSCVHCGEYVYPDYHNRESREWKDNMQIHLDEEHANTLAIE